MKLPARVVGSLADAQLNFEAIERQGIFVGTGVPAFVAKKGNVFIRTDDPTTANHRVYINTADGSNWTGIL